MMIITISSARSNLYKIAQTAINSHEPVIMTGKNGRVVLLSLEDYKSYSRNSSFASYS